MNEYPTWWNVPITIYNKYEDETSHEITWYRHAVDNCFWKYIYNRNNSGVNEFQTNTIICRIPKQVGFKERYEWESIEDKNKYFTLSPEDIIVRGIVTTEIDEYTKGSRSSDFLKRHKKLLGCLIVDSVTINTDGGRVAEHYLVTGM